jgi:predicted transposase YbfD/YdcC
LKTSLLNPEYRSKSGVAIREYYLTEDISWLSEGKKWTELKSIGCVRRTLEKLNGEMAVDTRYFIVSIVDVKVYAKSMRGHWEVENKVHGRLDFTFKDDQNTAMKRGYGMFCRWALRSNIEMTFKFLNAQGIHSRPPAL